MKSLLLATFITTFLCLGACSNSNVNEDKAITPDVGDFDFVHEVSDLQPDPNIIYGKLDNGVRYAVMPNETPTKTAALRVRFATGSLNESDPQQGLAHFLEHMAFNGSKNIPEGELIKRLERYGLRFGADTNAHTSFDETVYKLNLPEVSEEILDEAFMLMRETAENLTMAQDAIDRERGVVKSEKRTRDNAKHRASLAKLDFFTNGSRLMSRFPIGIDETLDSMDRDLFVQYYRQYYRPENTFVFLVGDVDPELAKGKIISTFADWQGVGEPGQMFDAGKATIEPDRVGYYQDPEIMTEIRIANAKPYTPRLDTAQTRRDKYVETLGFRILNRRFRTISKQSDSKIIFASSGISDYYKTNTVSGLTIRTQPDMWKEGLAIGEQELRRALEFGFSEAEFNEQIAKSRLAYEASAGVAESRPTTGRYGSGLATRVLNAYSNERVFTHPEAYLKRFESFADTITADEVWKAFKAKWPDLSAPLLYLETSIDLENPETKIREAYDESRKTPVKPMAKGNVDKFAYTDFGTPGKVVSDTHIKDADAHLIQFENNVYLNFKQTDFEKDRVRILIKIGDGSLSAPRKDEALRRLAYNVMAKGGYEAHSVDEIETIMAGKAARPSFRIDIEGDAFTLNAVTVPSDLDDQLNLFTAHVIAPGYRKQARDTYLKSLKAWFPTYDATASGVIAKEVPKFLRSGDERYGFPDLEKFYEPTIQEVKDWIGPQLENAMIDVTIIGDIDKDTAVKAIARTFGALPKRKAKHGKYPHMTSFTFPAGSSEPVQFYHAGDANRATLRIYWPTPDGTDPLRSRQLSILRGIVQNRMVSIIREEEAATYSPGVGLKVNQDFKDYGYMFVTLDIVPEKIPAMVDKIHEIATDFQAMNISEDEFERAIQPVLESLDSSLENNGYWVGVLSETQTDERGLDNFRTREATYKAMTLADIKPLAATVFKPENAVQIEVLPKPKD